MTSDCPYEKATRDGRSKEAVEHAVAESRSALAWLKTAGTCRGCQRAYSSVSGSPGAYRAICGRCEPTRTAKPTFTPVIKGNYVKTDRLRTRTSFLRAEIEADDAKWRRQQGSHQ